MLENNEHKVVHFTYASREIIFKNYTNTQN
jgi:hypothetical protein